MALVFSCGIKPKVQLGKIEFCVYALMIKYLGYTSVVKSLRTCERFDTSIYLQDHLQSEVGENMA